MVLGLSGKKRNRMFGFGNDTDLDREAVFEQLKIDEGVVYEI